MQEVEEFRDAIDKSDNIPTLQSSSSPLRVGGSQSHPKPEFSPIQKPSIPRRTTRTTAGVPPNRYESTKQEVKSEEKKIFVKK